MQIIIIDGWHEGHVLCLPHPSPEIKLLKPKSITICDCDDPNVNLPSSESDGEKFHYQSQELTYKVAFTSLDGNVALFSTTGKSMDIFGANFDKVFLGKPYGPNEVLYFGCHDPKSFK